MLWAGPVKACISGTDLNAECVTIWIRWTVIKSLYKAAWKHRNHTIIHFAVTCCMYHLPSAKVEGARRPWAYFLMLRTRSAAAGSFMRSRNSANERGAVCSANRISSAIETPLPVLKEVYKAALCSLLMTRSFYRISYCMHAP